MCFYEDLREEYPALQAGDPAFMKSAQLCIERLKTQGGSTQIRLPHRSNTFPVTF